MPESPGPRCPFCHDILSGLLAGCPKPDCLRRELDADTALDLAIGD